MPFMPAKKLPLVPLKVAASASPAVPVEELLCSLPKAATFKADARPDVRAGYRHFILHQKSTMLPMAEGFTDRALRESDQ